MNNSLPVTFSPKQRPSPKIKSLPKSYKHRVTSPVEPPVKSLKKVKPNVYYSIPSSPKSKPTSKAVKSLPLELQGNTPRYTQHIVSPINSPIKSIKKTKPGVYYSVQKSPRAKSPSRMVKSLPLKLTGKTPEFKQPSFDEVFWSEYKKGMDIHKYVESKIKQHKLEMDPVPTTKGATCKSDRLSLFPYQIVDTILGSPFSPLSKLLIIASTGTGKSCILVGIANYHIVHKHKHGIIFVGATDALYTNFIKQSMECPGNMKELATKSGWTDSNNIDHVQQFSTFMKQYIYPVNYTMFANMISGKYKKYQGLQSLKGKVILLDEAHYLVDSMSGETYAPTFQRMPKSWQANLKQMYTLLSDPNNANLEKTTIIGATATPITQSMMEYFALINLFAHRPMQQSNLCNMLKMVDQVEQGTQPESKLDACINAVQPIVQESVAMYTAKTSKKVLDTSVFPQMEFSKVQVPLTAEQARLIYTPKNHIMHTIK